MRQRFSRERRERPTIPSELIPGDEDDDRVSGDHAGAGHDSDYEQRTRAVISSRLRGSNE